MTRFEEALAFALRAHEGQRRKADQSLYILHPMEVAVIAASMTDDEDVLIAGLLHDTLEDTAVTSEEIRQRFGERVLSYVRSETEDKMVQQSKEATWKIRKEASLEELKNAADVNIRILWLSDKLANLRSFYRTYRKEGSALWKKLNQKDPQMHRWYFLRVAEYTDELKDTCAYREYTELIKKMFGDE